MQLFRDVESPLHRLHPSTKLIALFLLLVVGMSFNDPRYVLGAVMALFVIAAVGRSLPSVGRMWKFLAVLFTFATLLWSLFLRGAESEADALPYLGAGIEYAVAMGLRIDFLLISGIIFTACTRVEEFALGLQRLGVPYRGCFAISLAFRLLPSFSTSVATIVQAQMSRGLDVTTGNIITRLRRYLPLIVPALLSALRRADVLAMALESRGLGARPVRTSLLQPRVGNADVVAVGMMVAAVGLCLLLRLAGYGVVLPRI